MRPARLLTAVTLLVLVVAGGVVLLRSGADAPPGEVTGTPSVESSPPTPTATATTPAGPTAIELLTVPEAAATATLADLRAATDELLATTWSDAVVADWQPLVQQAVAGWPVVVGTAEIRADGAVAADLVIAAPQVGDELILRLLPAAEALGGAAPEVVATVDGQTVPAEVDRAGARLILPVPDEAGADGEVLVRVQVTYEVPVRSDITDDGGPAGYGLLARSDGLVALGHWLPVLTLPDDDGPMLPRGDVGGFPAAVWSLVVTHDGTMVTGGEEATCPDPRPECTWVYGAGLRDVAAVLFPEAETTVGTSVAVTAAPGDRPTEGLDAVAQFADAGMAALAERFGALPWPQVEVVGAPLDPGALGMEFPGIVWIDPGAWPGAGPDLGAYVLAHELGHQWFHALVGSGSLSDPVVDESLAQYLSYLVFADVFGDAAADGLAARSFGGRHARAIADGVPDEAPAQALGDFASARSYGAAVYGRGGQTWVDAERAAGRDAVVGVVRALVDARAFEVVTSEDVVRIAADVSPAVADVLRDGWGLP